MENENQPNQTLPQKGKRYDSQKRNYKKYYEANKEKCKEYHFQYYQHIKEHNPEEHEKIKKINHERVKARRQRIKDEIIAKTGAPPKRGRRKINTTTEAPPTTEAPEPEPEPPTPEPEPEPTTQAPEIIVELPPKKRGRPKNKFLTFQFNYNN